MIRTARINHLALPRFQTRVRRNSDVDIEKWGRRLVMLVILSWGISLVGGFETGLTALTLLGFFTAVYGIRKPALGILGIGILCTIDAVSRGYLLTGGLFRWNTFNYLLFLVIALNIASLFRREYSPMRILMVFISVLALQLFQSTDLDGGLQHLFGIIACLGLVAYFSRVSMDERIWKWFGLINGFIAAIGTGIFYVKGFAATANPNSFVFLPLTALFSICLAFRYVAGQKGVQFTMLVLAIVNVAWVFLSSSRSGLGIGLCCFIFLILQMRNVSNFVTVVLVGIILAFGVSAQFSQFEDYTISRFSKLFDDDRAMANRTSGRSDLFEGGWAIFLTSPVIGVGTGSFSDSWAQMTTGRNISYHAGKKADAHSAWIKVLVENGIVGIAILVTFIFSLLVKAWGRRRGGVLPLGILLTTILLVAFVTTEFQGKGIWLLVAGGLAVMQKGYPESEKPSRAVPVRRRGLRNSRDRVHA